MTITQLQYLLAVNNHRHFAKAAESCFVTQPTLSMQIQKLEEELGTLLFDRSKHPVRPTAIGEKIIAQAKIVTQESERVFDILQESKNQMSGVFKLGIIPTVLPSLVPLFFAKFKSAFPDVQLQIAELTTSQILESLKQDDLDAAIMATPLNESYLKEKPLYYEPFMAFIPPGHKLAKEQFITNSELDVNDILLLNEGHCFRNSVINLCNQRPHGENQALSLESGNFDILLKLSKKGFGMTLLPYLHATDLGSEDSKYVKLIAEPQPTREISMVYTRAELKVRIVEALSKIIKESVPEKLLSEKHKILSPVAQV